MNRTKSLVLTLMLCVIAFRASADSIQGTFVRSDNWKGVSGTGTVVITGTVTTRVRIFRHEGDLAIHGSIDWRPPAKILLFKSILKPVRKNHYTFSFEDSWGNKSEGRIQLVGNTVTLDLRILKRSEVGAHVADLYGNYVLTRVVKKTSAGKR